MSSLLLQPLTTTGPNHRVGFITFSPPHCQLRLSPLLLSEDTEPERGVNFISHLFSSRQNYSIFQCQVNSCVMCVSGADVPVGGRKLQSSVHTFSKLKD